MNAPVSTDSPLPIDDLVFDMVSSTASEVSARTPTRFHYRQDGALVWGRYGRRSCAMSLQAHGQVDTALMS
jgi:hypothetical protein